MIYMGADVRLTTLANGALTNAAAQDKLRRTSYQASEIDAVAPGITVLSNGFLNLTVIEAAEGLIVYDTGETLEDGEQLAKLIRTISDKPVVALIYSHSHYVHGATALLGNAMNAIVIGHPNVNANLATGGSGSLFAETAPIQGSRTLQQFNHYVPKSGADAAAGATLMFGRSGFVPVNTPVQDGQRLTVAGVEMQFFTRFGSDTDDCLTVYLPARRAVLNNLLWPFLPNIYTLRGAKFRDPREWREGLKLIRDLDPEVVTNTHARAIKGSAAVRATLDAVIDGLSAILDQTLRGILRGLGPDDLRSFVRLPRHLRDEPNLAEIYGEISHYGPYLYNAALGWFDGDAATINPLPPHDQALRLVDAMGGFAAVLQRANDAFAAKEFAWAVQLVGYLQRLDAASPDVRRLKADILQQMGRVTPAHTVRSWYLSQARALRGEVAIQRLSFANTRVLALAPPADSIEQYRVRIDPEKSANVDLVVVLAISDRGTRHAWHLRRGVVEFVADVGRCRRRPDIELATEFDNWLRFFSCKRNVEEFVSRATITAATPAQAIAFFSLFDDYAATR